MTSPVSLTHNDSLSLTIVSAFERRMMPLTSTAIGLYEQPITTVTVSGRWTVTPMKRSFSFIPGSRMSLLLGLSLDTVGSTNGTFLIPRGQS